jgi:hypothetical protein
MAYTYKELAEYIANMTEEQKNQDVTVYVAGRDEYYPLTEIEPVSVSDDECDVLNPGHVYLNLPG